jgi:tRNA-uridine 2-sulfurtransferase
MYYTLGQRQGLGIGGIKPNPKDARAPDAGAHLAWYVAEKNMTRNELIVVQGHDHALLQKPSLEAQDASWTAGSSPLLDEAVPLGAKTRYRQTDAPCTFSEENVESRFSLQFASPQWAVTPGQSAVLYQGDECLGGGIITA